MLDLAMILSGGVLAVCPPVGAPAPVDYEQIAIEVWAAGPRRPAVATGATGDPAVVGRWLPPMEWPVTAIHAVVLPTGEVLHYSYPAGGAGSRARVYDPARGTFEDVSMDTDLFCSGHSQLPDGRVYVTGGNDQGCDFRGLAVTHVFDPATRVWTQLEDMTDGRWYPSHVTLGDGRKLVVTGLDTACETNPVMEMFTPGAGLSVVPEGERALPLYPRLHLLSDGRIAHVGPDQLAHTFELGVGWAPVAWSEFGWRSDGTSVLIPGRTDEIMIIGGGNSSSGRTNTCEILDMGAAVPQWRATGSMHHARGHLDALILPDRTILVVGGGLADLYFEPVYVPELFDPDTETWIELPPYAYGRMYHSTTLLLPDGRVLVAGQDYGDSPYWGEIYEPPYLHRGARPVIDAAPAEVAYGSALPIASADAPSVTDVALVRLSSNTHSVNFEQRHVDVPFTVPGAAMLDGTAPSSRNVAPPGFYMLFILDGQGVPSEASIVRLCEPHPADLDGTGRVGFADLLALLAAWGPCGGCGEDLDGSGHVGFADLLAILEAWDRVCAG